MVERVKNEEEGRGRKGGDVRVSDCAKRTLRVRLGNVRLYVCMCVCMYPWRFFLHGES